MPLLYGGGRAARRYGRCKIARGPRFAGLSKRCGTTALLWPPNHKYTEYHLSDCATASDACGGDIDVDASGTIVSISSDEPEDALGKGDGSTLDDIVILSNSSYKVRAERQGGGNGRVYTIVYTVVDSFGSSTTGTCYVGAPHDQSGALPVNDGAAAGYTVTP